MPSDIQNTIFDPLRKRYVARTPEEEVRQKMIMWLNQKMGISLNLMMSEYSFRYNGLLYRADIVAFDRAAKIDTLVECKAPSVEIGNTVIEQGIRYNRVLKVRRILFTNGRCICGYQRIGDGIDYIPIDNY